MTIYTSGKTDKSSKNTDPEVVTEPLTNSSKDEEAVSPKMIQVTYFPKNKRTCCVHLLLTLMVLLILTCGGIGTYVFYKHFNKRTYSGVCGVRFFDSEYSNEMNDNSPYAEAAKMNDEEANSFYLKEDIEVSPVDQWEYLHTPSFQEVRETTVWHDFRSNYTAIVDHQLRRCNIHQLNRTAIAPPKSVFDLIDKLLNGYYVNIAHVIRRNYQVVNAIIDLQPYGRTIHEKCYQYDSYFIEKVSHVSKRSATPDETLAYAVLSNRDEAQEMYKIFISLK